MPATLDLDGSIQAALSAGDYGVVSALAFGAGVATSLTPCVYPMIAVTVSVFGARQTSSRREAALLSTAFVAGMTALFVPLGLLAATTGGLFGSALASPPVLIGLALLFAAFAASMFGAFDLDLPAGLKTHLAEMGGVGVRGAFVLGMVSALIAAPCTGPVLGGLLAFVGSSHDLLMGGVGLLAYAMGLGLLFWLVGTFAVALPKSGRWLGTVKSVFGVVMLTASLFYLQPLLPLSRPAWFEPKPAVWLGSAGLILAGIAAGALRIQFAHGGRMQRTRKGVGVACMVLGSMAVIELATLPSHEGWVWREDYQAARAEAAAQNKPVLIDFSASWCGACGELDRHTFSHPEVVREAQRFITVRVDLSPGKDSDQKRELLASYAQRGLPLVVLHDARGSEAGRVTGFVDAQRFLDMLRAVP